MDTDLSKSLEQLQIKKKSINLDADLSRECKSIVELDGRLALLLNEIQSLRRSVNEQSLFVDEKCDLLSPSYRNLERTSQLFEFSAQLTKLNRLCKRIDKIQAFRANQQHLIDPMNLKSGLMKANNENLAEKDTNIDEGVDDYDDEITSQALEISRQFEFVYKPLEDLLSKRSDLPYVSYANKVRNLLASLKASPSYALENIKHEDQNEGL